MKADTAINEYWYKVSWKQCSSICSIYHFLKTASILFLLLNLIIELARWCQAFYHRGYISQFQSWLRPPWENCMLASPHLRKLYAGFTPPEKTVCWLQTSLVCWLQWKKIKAGFYPLEKTVCWLHPLWKNCTLPSTFKKKTGMLIYRHHNLIPFTLGASGVSTCSPRSMTLIWHKIRNFTKCVIMLFVFSLGSKRSGICSK